MTEPNSNNSIPLNVTSGEYVTCVFESLAAKVVAATAWSLLLAFSFVGNILLVVAVFKSRVLQSTNSYFTVNMAVSNLLVPLFVIPRRLQMVFIGKGWLLDGALGSFFCKLVPFAGEISLPISILTMVVIAVERFYCVVFPLKPPLVTTRMLRRIIASTWIFAAAYLCYYFAIFELRHLNSKAYCVALWEAIECDAELKGKTILHEYLALFVCISILPFFALAILYTIIVIALYRQKKIIYLAPKPVRHRAKRNKNITFMSLTVVVAFVAVWAPFWVLSIQVMGEGYHNISYIFIEFASYLPLTYTVITPVTYYIFNQKFRQQLKYVLKCS